MIPINAMSGAKLGFIRRGVETRKKSGRVRFMECFVGPQTCDCAQDKSDTPMSTQRVEDRFVEAPVPGRFSFTDKELECGNLMTKMLLWVMSWRSGVFSSVVAPAYFPSCGRFNCPTR